MPVNFDRARTMWASPKLREIWQERMRRVSNNWTQAQVISVLEGMRDGALEYIPDHQFRNFIEKYTNQGLSVLPLEFAYGKVRVYIGRNPSEFHEAYSRGDDQSIGYLLGFPKCCIEWFGEIWKGQTDPTLYMKDHDGPFTANILARWMGVRYVPHLPCAGSCESSAKYGEAFRELVPPQIREYADEILSWPVRWTALHGVMEIMFPVCKMQGLTEYTSELKTFDRTGTVRPHYGPNGMVHPFGGLARALPLGDAYGPIQDEHPSLWQYNGFSTREGMDIAHKGILSQVQTCDSDVICDLGAGNGQLLSSLKAKRRIGVESDLQRASASLPGIEMVHCKVQDYVIPPEVTVALVAPIRLIEESSPQLIEQLRRIPKVYVYGYGDTLTQYGGLMKECEKADLNGVLQPLGKTAEVEIALWKGVS